MTSTFDNTRSIKTPMNEVSTITCIPPEAVEEGKETTYNEKVDVYGFAMVLFEMLSGEPPNLAENIHALIRKLIEENKASGIFLRRSTLTLTQGGAQVRPPIDADLRRYSISAQLVDIMEKCWNHDPRACPSFRELLQMLEPLRGMARRNMPLFWSRKRVFDLYCELATGWPRRKTGR